MRQMMDIAQVADIRICFALICVRHCNMVPGADLYDVLHQQEAAISA
jgi:hypothetical protein